MMLVKKNPFTSIRKTLSTRAGRITCILCYTLLPAFLFAQNAAGDIKKINAYYASHNFSCEVSYKMYDSWQASKTNEEKKGTIKKWDQYTYYKVGNMETYHTPTAYMAVDHDKKTIFISSIRTGLPAPDESAVPDLAPILKLCKSVSYKDEPGGKGMYTLNYPSKETEKVTFTFDKEQFFLSQLIIYSKVVDKQDVKIGRLNQPRIAIDFSKVHELKKYSESDFSMDKFIRKNGNKLACAPQYASYKLINQLTKQ